MSAERRPIVRKDIPSPKEAITIEAISAVPDHEASSDSLKFTRRLVTMEYLRHFGVRQRGTDYLLINFPEAYRAMYESDKEYQTKEILGLMLFETDGQSRTAPVSTIRLLSGKKGKFPIEAAKYFSHPDGWDSINPVKIGELGRLAFVPFRDLRIATDTVQAKKIRARLLRRKTQRAAEQARHQGITEIEAVMPENIWQLYEMEDMSPQPIEGAEIMETEENTKLFDQFPGYWRKLDPKLYRWNVADILGKRTPPTRVDLIVNPRVRETGK